MVSTLVIRSKDHSCNCTLGTPVAVVLCNILGSIVGNTLGKCNYTLFCVVCCIGDYSSLPVRRYNPCIGNQYLHNYMQMQH